MILIEVGGLLQIYWPYVYRVKAYAPTQIYLLDDVGNKFCSLV